MPLSGPLSRAGRRLARVWPERPLPRLLLLALAAAVVVGVSESLRGLSGLSRSLGDTDDATRLVLVRSLLQGGGWWDQRFLRFQPPVGVFMHWSRLLDGAIAALYGALELVLPQPSAEWWTRLLWPLLWVFPGAAATLGLAHGLGSAAETPRRQPVAPLIAAMFLVTNYTLYLQFRPGRVDHHDVQMVFFLLSAAGYADRRGRRGAILSGISTGLGLAVGLEALVFDALIGAAFALDFAARPERGRRLAAYGLALSGTALLAFGIQTPPGRWGIAACDALAVNSAAALVVAGLGLAAASRLSGASALARTAAVALAGAAAAAAYLGLDPRCLKGPFADVDPALKRFWLPHVQEMRPMPVLWARQPDDAVYLSAPPVMAGLAAAGAASLASVRRDGLWRLCAALLLATSLVGFTGVRMAGYADWLSMAILAAAVAAAAERFATWRRRDPWVMLTIFGLAATPALLTAGVVQARGLESRLASHGRPRPRAREVPDHCFDTAPYRLLAAAPPGLVLSEIDLGPFIVANSRDDVLAAPYHRMSWGLIRSRAALSADADRGAAAAVRELGARYVLECRAHARHADRDGMSPSSLQKRLDAGRPPAWLTRIGPKGGILELYRVEPVPGDAK